MYHVYSLDRFSDIGYDTRFGVDAMKDKSTKPVKIGLTPAQQEELDAARMSQTPAGITFLNDHEIPATELKKSVRLITRMFSPQMQEEVKKAFQDSSE